LSENNNKQTGEWEGLFLGSDAKEATEEGEEVEIETVVDVAINTETGERITTIVDNQPSEDGNGASEDKSSDSDTEILVELEELGDDDSDTTTLTEKDYLKSIALSFITHNKLASERNRRLRELVKAVRQSNSITGSSRNKTLQGTLKE